MSTAKLTYEDWQSALQEAMSQRGPNGRGKTVNELMAISGKSTGLVKRALVRFKEQGRLVVGKDYREALDNSMRLVTVYSVKK